MKTAYLRGALLDHAFKNTAYTQPAHLYVGLSTADPTDSGGSLAEPAGNAYARVNLDTWTRTAGQVVNNGAITFPQASGSWGLITYWGIFDALTAGNLLWRAPIITDIARFDALAATSILYTNGAVTFANNDLVRVYAKTVPAGLSANQLYYVINASAAGDSFQLSLTQGGAAVSVTADGCGYVGHDGSKSIGLNDTPSFASGQLQANDE